MSSKSGVAPTDNQNGGDSTTEQQQERPISLSQEGSRLSQTVLASVEQLRTLLDLMIDERVAELLEESAETYFFSYQWRFMEKWSLQAFYSQFEASGRKIATKDFNYDGVEYTAGVGLETDFNLDTYLLESAEF